MDTLDRRSFIVASAASLPVLSSIVAAQETRTVPQSTPPAPGTTPAPATPVAPRRPIVISSANGRAAVTKAMEMMRAGNDPLDSIVAGINIVEDDPEDMSVGYGGLPNEEGEVELDASCMHGPSHKAGAVAGLKRIKNPSSVALQVLRRTDHALLVGEGALQFARQMGFQEQNLLTEKAREAWLKWKADLNRNDKWLDEDQQIPPGAGAGIGNGAGARNPLPQGGRGQGEGAVASAHDIRIINGIPYTTGTIHCSAVDVFGNMSACTSTSGLSWKIPGRVGDSPIVGAGMFCQNEIGSAGATGRGEAMIQSCGSFQIVQHMAAGLSPTEACLKVLKWIADHTKQSYLLDDKGRPNFGLTLYALRNDGAYGSATMHKGTKFTVHDGTAARLEECAALFED